MSVHRLFRHKLLIAGVAVAAAASAGGAVAATQSTSTPRQALIADVAKRLGVSPSRLRAAIRGALLDRLNAAVKAGQLTQAQADRLKQRSEQGGGLPFGGPMFRHGRPGLERMRHSLLPVAAAYLGLSRQQLLSDLEAGKTLAQVAQAQNKSLSGLEQALVAAAKVRLERLVAAKQITTAQEQQRLSRLSARIAKLVNHARVERYGAFDGPPPGGGGGPWGGGPMAAPSHGGPMDAPSSGAPMGPQPAA